MFIKLLYYLVIFYLPNVKSFESCSMPKRVSLTLSEESIKSKKESDSDLSPLAESIVRMDKDFIRILLRSGIDVTNDKYVINVAILSGNKTLVKLLIGCDAKITKADVRFAEGLNQSKIAEVIKRHLLLDEEPSLLGSDFTVRPDLEDGLESVPEPESDDEDFIDMFGGCSGLEAERSLLEIKKSIFS
jgi:hypothetical protein